MQIGIHLTTGCHMNTTATDTNDMLLYMEKWLRFKTILLE